MTPRDKIRTIKDFEKFLRVRGFSRAEATAIASVGYAKGVKSKSKPAASGELRGGRSAPENKGGLVADAVCSDSETTKLQNPAVGYSRQA